MLATVAHRWSPASLLGVLAVLASAVAAVVVLTSIVRTFNAPPVQPSPLKPSAVVWADRVFSRDRSLAHWLGARGHNYSTWAKRHPAASRVFEKR
jgi:hypothetical protein